MFMGGGLDGKGKQAHFFPFSYVSQKYYALDMVLSNEVDSYCPLQRGEEGTGCQKPSLC